jgi:hypothetical protein
MTVFVKYANNMMVMDILFEQINMGFNAICVVAA